MKTKIYFLIAALQVLNLQSADAQNGLTVYSMPSGYTNIQVRFKNCITTDAANDVYVGFRDIGLGKFTPSTSTWVMFDTTNSGIPANNVKSLAFDISGNL